MNVISTGFGEAADFGYSTFSFVAVEIDQFLVQVSVYDSGTSNFELTDFSMKVTNRSSGTVYSDESYPASTTLMQIPKTNDTDLIALEASKVGYESVTVTKTLVELRQYFEAVTGGNGPLIIVLLEKQFALIQDSDTIFDFSGESLTTTSTSWISMIGSASLPIGGVYTSNNNGGVILNGVNQSFGRIQGSTLGFTPSMTGWTFEFLGVYEGLDYGAEILYDGTTTTESINGNPNATGFLIRDIGTVLAVINSSGYEENYSNEGLSKGLVGELIYAAGSVDITNQVIRLFINGEYFERSTGWDEVPWLAAQNLQGTISLGYRDHDEEPGYFEGTWNRFIGHKRAFDLEDFENNYNYFKNRLGINDF